MKERKQVHQITIPLTDARNSYHTHAYMYMYMYDEQQKHFYKMNYSLGVFKKTAQEQGRDEIKRVRI